MSVGAFGVGMDRQFAEQAAERLVLIQRQFLVAKEQHLMRHQRVVDFLELLIAQWTGEVDAGDFGADGGGGGRDRDRLIGHGASPLFWRSACPFALASANLGSYVETEQQNVAVLD